MTAKPLDEAQAEIDRVADAILAAEYLLVCGGPLFDDASSNPFDSEYCTSSLISNPNKFMGFWGAYYNEYADKIPHEGYNILAKFRDKLFSAEDVRKRNKKTKGDTQEEDQFVRFMVYTGHIGNSFQKAGIPDQEMMEVCGNLMTWQCGVNPICCARTFGIERGFKFFIDPLTFDARPIKYVPPRHRPDPKPFRQLLVDSDDDEAHFRQTIDRDILIKGATAEDRAKRLLRLKNYCRATRLNPQIQLLDHRFPDLFTGFVTHVGGALETYTFDGMPLGGAGRSLAAYEEAKRRNANGGEGSGGAGEDGAAAQKKDANQKDAPPPPPPKPCAQPIRCSHLLAHVNAVDRGMYEDHRGAFSVVDVEKWRYERDAAFGAIGKGPMAMESHSISSKREKYLKYNVSLTFVQDTSSAAGASVTGVGRHAVLPPALREKLLKPYNSKDPIDARAEEGVIEELMSSEMKDWRQSGNGWYYFSNVGLSRTQQEPIHNSYIDFVKIDVPQPTNTSTAQQQRGAGTTSRGAAAWNNTSYGGLTGLGGGGGGGFEMSVNVAAAAVEEEEADATAAAATTPIVMPYLLPTKGMISIVVETVMLAEGDHVPPQHVKTMAAQQQAGVLASSSSSSSSSEPLAPNPYVYTNNVWQMVGIIDTAAMRGEGAAQLLGLTSYASGGGTKASANHSKDAFEYILEGRKGHVLHIGSLRSNPQQITYIHLEVPHSDWDQQGISTRLVRPMRDNGSSTLNSNDGGGDGPVISYLEQQRLAEEAANNRRNAEELVPTLNHVLCMGCREIARPYVIMTSKVVGGIGGPNGAKKDDGFAMAAMNQRNKAYKAWEKKIIDALKQDQNKSIVILEVGADRKMDPARLYSEKTFKVLKTAKCTFVRLSEFNLDSKPTSGPASDSTNMVSIICNPIAGLQALERAVNERLEKKMNKQQEKPAATPGKKPRKASAAE